MCSFYIHWFMAKVSALYSSSGYISHLFNVIILLYSKMTVDFNRYFLIKIYFPSSIFEPTTFRRGHYLPPVFASLIKTLCSCRYTELLGTSEQSQKQLIRSLVTSPRACPSNRVSELQLHLQLCAARTT